MAAQTMFSVGMFPMGVQMMEDAPSMSELPRNNLPVPQLVMLANVATVGSVDGAATESVADDKEMVELTTVGCSYSDSEDSEESVRYSYDSHNNMEVCIVEYVNSPGVPSAATGNDRLDEEEEEGDDNAEDLSKPLEPGPPVSPQTPQPDTKRKTTHATVVENAKKKKPFHCKPCNFQAQNEEQFVEHLGTHGVNKMAVVNRVEARSKIKSGEMGGCGTQATEGGGDAENGGDAGATTDSKGVIRCERCGYNTNRTDHYIAHLKHHSKEGEDHRVLKCTLCPYTTVSQYHWRKHLRNHFPSKLHTCSQCSYYSDRKSNYIQHIRTHTGVRPFRCDYCEYSSSQKTHLTRHMRTHSGERPFKCESCNYLAANQHEVTRHARQVHNGPKPLACPYCQYKTADRSNFKKHVELHLNPRQFLCPLCKYAASKKCNLQYHIKSRHSGCDIAIDVSKVKLRVKKADQETGGEGNAGHSSVDEDDGDAEEEIESIDKQLSPINLSIVKSGSPGSAQALVEETVDKVQRKCEATADKDKPQEGNAKVERKVMTRQKKVAKIGAKAKEKTVVKDAALETAAPAKSKDFKVKRRSKKQNAETVSVQDQVETTESSGKAKRENSEKDAMGVDVARSKAEKEKPEKEKKEDEAKVAKEKEEQLKNEGGKKENKRLKSRKSGARKPDKPSERVEEAPCKDDLKKTENNKLRKTKAVKRKFVEALDLSTKPPSAEAGTGPTKSKRLKAKASDKPPSKPSSPEVICNAEGSPAPQKDHQAEEKTAPGPVKQKKTRRTGKKAPAHQCSVAPIEDKQDSVGVDASSPLQHSSSAEPPNAPGQETQQPTEAVAAHNPTETQPEQQDAAPEETSEPVPELTSDIAKEPAAASSTSSGEETPSPAEDFPPPMFRRPTKPARPSLELPGQRGKPADAEEDEGIHSSHEGGSDISDSASEGSDDSGLNGAGAGSGKMPNDPETPTEEIPTPTELKSHTCIFCDRTFPLEVAYRRHLNRHLVNVYYMDNTAKSGK